MRRRKFSREFNVRRVLVGRLQTTPLASRRLASHSEIEVQGPIVRRTTPCPEPAGL